MGCASKCVERPPVAALVVGGASTAVAADGVVLGPGFLSSSLPLLNAGKAATATSAVTTTLPPVGGSVRGGALLGALTVLGAAPAPLAHAVTRVYSGSKGLTVALHGGLLAYFGDATRPHAKWLSLARVLADPSSAGAVYIDVRLPERPAAGFAPGTTRPDASSVELESSGASDPNTAAELASGLDTAVGGVARARVRASAAARARNRVPAAKRRSRARPRLKPGRANRRRAKRRASRRPRKQAPRKPPKRPPRAGFPGVERPLATARPTIILDLRLEPVERACLGVRSRVPGSATIVARLDGVVDRAKFPA